MSCARMLRIVMTCLMVAPCVHATEARCDATDGCPATEEDNTALLQGLHGQRFNRRSQLAAAEALQNDCNTCPGSGTGCSGDQCCPGVAESGGLTFPCPSASPNFNQCQSQTRLGSCTQQSTGTPQSPGTPQLPACDHSACNGCAGVHCLSCRQAEDVKCCLMEKCQRCGGEQCTDCHREHRAECCAGKAWWLAECRAGLLQNNQTRSMQGQCNVGDSVPCPGSDNECAGDQCCPGAAESGGLTFPCPSSSASYNQCQSQVRLGDCTGQLPACDHSVCNGCSGTQCETCRQTEDVKCCLKEKCHRCSGEQCADCQRDHRAECCLGKAQWLPECQTGK